MSFFTINYFALFGLEEQYEQSVEKIKTGYLKLQRELHPDRFVGAAPQTKQLAVHYAAEVNQAYQTLLDPVLRAIYLLKLRGMEWQEEGSVSLPPDFWMEQMTFRERLEELKENSDENARTALKEAIEAKRRELEQSPGYPQDLTSVYKMQFYAKLDREMVC